MYHIDPFRYLNPVAVSCLQHRLTGSAFQFRRKHPYIAGLCGITLCGCLSICWRVRRIVYRIVYDKCRDLFHWVKTRLVNYYMHKPSNPYYQVRSVFRETPTPRIFETDKSHTHPACAAWRSSCTKFARSVAQSFGLSLLSYQGSNADVRDGLKVSREYHWMKDVVVAPARFEPGVRELTVIVDVDYYVDVPKLLVELGRKMQPVMLYTFQPQSVSCGSGEFRFHFDKDNNVHYYVSGGAHYVHQVWNYSKDIISVTYGFETVAYMVERRQANAHHEYVLLIPLGRWSGFGSYIARLLGTDAIERLSVVRGDFAMLDVQGKDCVKRSVGRLGNFASATIDAVTFDTVANVVRGSSVKVGQATMVSWVEDRVVAASLVDFFQSNTKYDKPPIVYPVELGIRTFHLLDNLHEYDQAAKAIMSPFMAPVLPKTFVPARTLLNERMAVRGRIEEPLADAKLQLSTNPCKAMPSYMEEFVNFLIPVKHQLQPCEISDVYERQNRPSQRVLLNQADNDGGRAKLPWLQTFMKAEPYGKVTDPRVITTFDSVTKRDYSCFIYPLADVVSLASWYVFGKEPKTIALAIAAICAASAEVSCSDLNRMDGHISIVLRTLELMVLLAAYAERLHEQIRELYAKQSKRKAVTREGIQYFLDTQRGSGGPDTAFFNTVDTKFIDYVARRESGASPDEAYYCPMMAGGDDVISGDVSGSQTKRCAAMVGQSVDVVIFRRGESGVNFLSRFFTDDVWSGGCDSSCDLPRALSKLHVTPHLGEFTPLEKLSQKLSGLSRTDANTPVISQILSAARRVGLSLDADFDKRVTGWWGGYALDVNWPNNVDDSAIGMLGDCDVKPLFAYLNDCKTPGDLLTMPSIVDLSESVRPAVKRMAVVDDQILLPPPVELPKFSFPIQDVPVVFGLKKKNPAPVICWSFVDGKCSFGPKCKFEHKQVCKAFLAGGCPRKVCKFPHIVRAAAPILVPPHD